MHQRPTTLKLCTTQTRKSMAHPGRSVVLFVHIGIREIALLVCIDNFIKVIANTQQWYLRHCRQMICDIFGMPTWHRPFKQHRQHSTTFSIIARRHSRKSAKVFDCCEHPNLQLWLLYSLQMIYTLRRQCLWKKFYPSDESKI